MRNSKQRDLICSIVQSSCDHPSAETVYERARAVMPDISLGTVYRNLNQLADGGEILRIGVASGHDRFDKTVCTHVHFHCRECNSVFDVDCGAAGELAASAELLGNRVEKTDVLFTGVCKECLDRKNNY